MVFSRINDPFVQFSTVNAHVIKITFGVHVGPAETPLKVIIIPPQIRAVVQESVVSCAPVEDTTLAMVFQGAPMVPALPSFPSVASTW